MDKSPILEMKAVYETAIDAIKDTTTQARARLALANWERAEVQYAEILEASATNYSTSGRSVTKRAIESAIRTRNDARMELDGEIGGPNAGVTYADNGGTIW